VYLKTSTPAVSRALEDHRIALTTLSRVTDVTFLEPEAPPPAGYMQINGDGDWMIFMQLKVSDVYA